MCCGDYDAAIAEAAAAVTHVESQSQEVGSGDEGLGLLCSSRKQSSPCVPTTVVVLKQPSQSIHTSRKA